MATGAPRPGSSPPGEPAESLATCAFCVRITNSFEALFDGRISSVVNHSLFLDGQSTRLVGCTNALRLINMADGEWSQRRLGKAIPKSARLGRKPYFPKRLQHEYSGLQTSCMHMKKVIVALFFAAVFLFGCSTPEKVAREQGHGPAHIYYAPYDKTWKAAVDSAWDRGLTVLRVYPEQGFISAKRGMSATTFGEDVGIWLKEAGAGKTQVEVVSRQKGLPMLQVKNWEDDLFQSIGERVGGPPFNQGTAPGPVSTIRASESK